MQYLELAVTCSRVSFLHRLQVSSQALREALKLISSELVAIQLRLHQAQVALLIQLVVGKGHAGCVYEAMVLLQRSGSREACCLSLCRLL